MKFPTILLYLESAKICLKDWKRFLLACVLNILPLINLITLGYVIESMRLYRENPDHRELPAWKSIWELFLLGLKTSIVCMAWLLPILLIMAIGYFLAEMLLVMIVLTFIAVGLVYYLIPSILIHESQGFGKSFCKETISFAMTWDYQKQMFLVTVINVPFAMLGQVIPLTLTVTITLLLLMSSRGFALAYVAYSKKLNIENKS